MEIYKWKWMVLGALGCMNNADFEEKKLVNYNIVLDMFIICQKLRHVQVIKIILYAHVLIDLQSNPPNSDVNDVEGHESHPFCTTLDLQLSFIALYVITVELTAL